MPWKWMFRSVSAGDNRTSNGSVENASPYDDGCADRHGRCFHRPRADLRAGPFAAKSEEGNRKRTGLLRSRAVAAARHQAICHLAGRTGAAEPEGDAAADAVAWRRAAPAGEVATNIEHCRVGK